MYLIWIFDSFLQRIYFGKEHIECLHRFQHLFEWKQRGLHQI